MCKNTQKEADKMRSKQICHQYLDGRVHAGCSCEQVRTTAVGAAVDMCTGRLM